MIRLFLVGFMGAGKTTLGRALARELGVELIDMDSYLTSRFHTTVPQLFAERGEDGFRRLERSVLHEVGEFEDVIIATGGGVPCFFDNMDYMNAQGTTVWLQASPEVLHTRLTISHSQRPLVDGMTADELTAYIAQALASRGPHYAKAAYTFAADQLEDHHQIAESVQRFKNEIPLKP